MYQKVILTNFRSYKDFQTALSPGTNIIIGPNASGKTNLLEAIYFVNQGKSFKANAAGMINFDADWARVEAITQDKRVAKIKTENGTVKKEFDLATNQFKRLPHQHKLATTLFEPTHLRLLQGSPERRRDYLDEMIGQLDPLYSDHRNSYQRALKQRNNLLKQDDNNIDDQIFVWNLKLAQHGAYLTEARLKNIEQINEGLQDIYRQLTGKKHILIAEYQTRVKNNYKEKLLNLLSRNVKQDREKGFTTAGPHRDDFTISIDEHDASLSASRGETRTLVLGLKMIEMKLLENSLEAKPMILLDDVFSELDGRRRKLLTKTLKDYQTIITTTDADIISKDFLGKSNIIPTKTN